jgi:hypothetical protein
MIAPCLVDVEASRFLLFFPLFNRPAAVGFDDLVNLSHRPCRLLERDDDPLVVGDVPRRERVARPAAPSTAPPCPPARATSAVTITYVALYVLTVT